MKRSFVYILANRYRNVLYVGVTTNLTRRIKEHKNGYGSKFTSRYNVKMLMYYEEFTDLNQAILREKQLKNWKRAWKWALISTMNPELKDLYDEVR